MLKRKADSDDLTVVLPPKRPRLARAKGKDTGKLRRPLSAALAAALSPSRSSPASPPPSYSPAPAPATKPASPQEMPKVFFRLPFLYAGARWMHALFTPTPESAQPWEILLNAEDLLRLGADVEWEMIVAGALGGNCLIREVGVLTVVRVSGGGLRWRGSHSPQKHQLSFPVAGGAQLRQLRQLRSYRASGIQTRGDAFRVIYRELPAPSTAVPTTLPSLDRAEAEHLLVRLLCSSR